MNPSSPFTLWDRVRRDPATGFGVALYFALGLNLIQGIWLMRLLDPSDYGRWLELFLIYAYGQHYHLGIRASVLRQLPLMRGKGEQRRSEELLGAAHSSMLLFSAGWVVLGGAAAWLLYPDSGRFALVVVVITVFEAWSELAIAEMKTAHRFMTVGGLTVLRSALNLGLLVLVARYELLGAYIRWGVLLLVMTAAFWIANPVRAAWRWSRPDMRFLIADGGPILLVGVMFSMQVSMDKTLIKAFLDAEAMGRYGAAATLMTVMMIIPTSVGQTAYPRMLEAFGRGVRPSEMIADVRTRCLTVGAMSAAVATLGGLAMPTLLGWVLPRYLAGVHAAQWLLPGTVFLSMSVPASYFLQTIRRQRLHALVSAIGVIAQIALGSAVLSRGGDIEELAMTTSLSLLIYMLLLAGAAAWASRRDSVQGSAQDSADAGPG